MLPKNNKCKYKSDTKYHCNNFYHCYSLFSVSEAHLVLQKYSTVSPLLSVTAITLSSTRDPSLLIIKYSFSQHRSLPQYKNCVPSIVVLYAVGYLSEANRIPFLSCAFSVNILHVITTLVISKLETRFTYI